VCPEDDGQSDEQWQELQKEQGHASHVPGYSIAISILAEDRWKRLMTEVESKTENKNYITDFEEVGL
jgi:hypothetical protein